MQGHLIWRVAVWDRRAEHSAASVLLSTRCSVFEGSVFEGVGGSRKHAQHRNNEETSSLMRDAAAAPSFRIGLAKSSSAYVIAVGRPG